MQIKAGWDERHQIQVLEAEISRLEEIIRAQHAHERDLLMEQHYLENKAEAHHSK
jgi:hypothetical protein